MVWAMLIGGGSADDCSAQSERPQLPELHSKLMPLNSPHNSSTLSLQALKFCRADERNGGENFEADSLRLMLDKCSSLTGERCVFFFCTTKIAPKSEGNCRSLWLIRILRQPRSV